MLRFAFIALLLASALAQGFYSQPLTANVPVTLGVNYIFAIGWETNSNGDQLPTTFLFNPTVAAYGVNSSAIAGYRGVLQVLRTEAPVSGHKNFTLSSSVFPFDLAPIIFKPSSSAGLIDLWECDGDLQYCQLNLVAGDALSVVIFEITLIPTWITPQQAQAAP